MEIKKFESFDSPKGQQTVEERYNAHFEVFGKAMSRLREIMEQNFGSPEGLDWADIGSFAHINEDLVNIIEGWDEDLASELRKKMEHNYRD